MKSLTFLILGCVVTGTVSSPTFAASVSKKQDCQRLIKKQYHVVDAYDVWLKKPGIEWNAPVALERNYFGVIESGYLGQPGFVWSIKLGQTNSGVDEMLRAAKEIVENRSFYNRLNSKTELRRLVKHSLYSVENSQIKAKETVDNAVQYIGDSEKPVRDNRVRNKDNVYSALEWANFYLAMTADNSLKWLDMKAIEALIEKADTDDVGNAVRTIVYGLYFKTNRALEASDVLPTVASMVPGKENLLILKAVYQATKLQTEDAKLAVLEAIWNTYFHNTYPTVQYPRPKLTTEQGEELSLEQYILYISGKPYLSETAEIQSMVNNFGY